MHKKAVIYQNFVKLSSFTGWLLNNIKIVNREMTPEKKVSYILKNDFNYIISFSTIDNDVNKLKPLNWINMNIHTFIHKGHICKTTN